MTLVRDVEKLLRKFDKGNLRQPHGIRFELRHELGVILLPVDEKSYPVRYDTLFVAEKDHRNAVFYEGGIQLVGELVGQIPGEDSILSLRGYVPPILQPARMPFSVRASQIKGYEILKKPYEFIVMLR